MKCIINAHGVIRDSLEGHRKGRRQDSSTPRKVGAARPHDRLLAFLEDL
jgi:hypothetical protein